MAQISIKQACEAVWRSGIVNINKTTRWCLKGDTYGAYLLNLDEGSASKLGAPLADVSAPLLDAIADVRPSNRPNPNRKELGG